MAKKKPEPGKKGTNPFAKGGKGKDETCKKCKKSTKDCKCKY